MLPSEMPSEESVYRARTRTASHLLYLDFDGVLHHEEVYVSPKRGIYISERHAPGATLFEWAPLLVDALAPHPHVRIVLSTSWCRQPGYGRALRRLPLELQRRAIGGTFHRRVHGADPLLLQSFVGTPRGLQILADVRRRRPLDWISLDDDVDGWPVEHLGNLVACDGALGLSCPDTLARLKARLAGMPPAG